MNNEEIKRELIKKYGSDVAAGILKVCATQDIDLVEEERKYITKNAELNRLFIDCETDGLWGDPISIGAVFTDCQGNRKSFYKWIKDYQSENPWVQENVVPSLAVDGYHSVSDLNELLKSFADFYNWLLSITDNHVNVVWHMGSIVETHMFRLLVENKLIGEWNAPYTPVELSTMLEMKGYAPDSVDAVVSEHNLSVKFNGATHNALYDACVEEVVYHFLRKKK